MMRVHKMGVALLLLLLLSGCSSMGAASPAKEGEDELSIAALFQTESGDALHGSAAYFSTETNSDNYQVGNDGTANISGLPRKGELLLTLFDQQQEIQGTITLSFSEGAVIDAMTGEDGVGHITVRNDTNEVALIFVLTEDGTLRCTLWLARTVSSGADLTQKGV